MSIADKVTENLMKNSGFKLFTVVLIISIIGSFRYHVVYFGQFNISIVNFAGTIDWISLGLGKLPLSLSAFLLLALPLAGIIYGISEGMYSDSTVLGCFFVVLFFLLIFGWPFAMDRFAKNDAKCRKSGEPKGLLISSKKNLVVDIFTYNNDTIKELTFIGSTSNYMFLYHKEGNNLDILRKEDIQKMVTHNIPVKKKK